MSLVTLLLPFLVTSSFARVTHSIDAKKCEAQLSPKFMKDLIAGIPERRSLGGSASFIPGDSSSTILIDVRGTDDHKLSESLIAFLQFNQPSESHPKLVKIIEAALLVAHRRNALVSVSTVTNAEKVRMIRVSLDINANTGNDAKIVRLPETDIQNGSASERIDIDILPDRLTLLVATTQAITGFGTVVVGEPASHSLGLEIDAKDPHHPVLDAMMAKTQYFIGPNSQPQLRDLLSITEEVARAIYPETEYLSFRTKQEIQAINQGRGWIVRN